MFANEKDPLDVFETCCKYCVFANYEGKTQVGCNLGRLEKFEFQGVRIEECYDEDNEFCVIKDRICNTCRDHNWAKPGETLAEMQVRIRQEVTLKASVFVYVDEHIDSVVDILDTLEGLDGQSLRPADVTVINNSRGKIKNSAIMNLLRQTKLQWFVENIEDTNKSKNRALDLCIRKTKNQYYIILNSGAVLAKDFILNIDEALNDHLDRFLMLEPDGPTDDGLVVLTKIHKIFNGNVELPIQEKINLSAKNEGKLNLVKKYKDLICNKNQITSNFLS